MPYRTEVKKPKRKLVMWTEKPMDKPTFSSITLYLAFTLVLGTMVRAAVMFELWGWFVIPAGGPHLSVWNIMGLALLGKLVASSGSHTEKDEEWTNGKLALNAALVILWPLLWLGVGWVFHALM